MLIAKPLIVFITGLFMALPSQGLLKSSLAVFEGHAVALAPALARIAVTASAWRSRAYALRCLALMCKLPYRVVR